MAENPDLLTHLRDFLIAEGIARDPRTAGDDPPFWRNPRDGAIAPGEKAGNEADDGVVVSAFLTDGVAAGVTDDPYFRGDVVTMRVRATSPKAAFDFDWRLRAALVGEAYGQRQSFDLAGLTIISAQLWRPLSFVGSDEQGFDYSTGYIFQLYT